jgi:hypothetical protein
MSGPARRARGPAPVRRTAGLGAAIPRPIFFASVDGRMPAFNTSSGRRTHVTGRHHDDRNCAINRSLSSRPRGGSWRLQQAQRSNTAPSSVVHRRGSDPRVCSIASVPPPSLSRGSGNGPACPGPFDMTGCFQSVKDRRHRSDGEPDQDPPERGGTLRGPIVGTKLGQISGGDPAQQSFVTSGPRSTTRVPALGDFALLQLNTATNIRRALPGADQRLRHVGR